VLICASFLLRPPLVSLVVLLLELAFRLQPVVQVAAVNSATLDVNLKRSMTDFGRGWLVLYPFFRDIRPKNDSWGVLSIRFQVLRSHGLFSFQRISFDHDGPPFRPGTRWGSRDPWPLVGVDVRTERRCWRRAELSALSHRTRELPIQSQLGDVRG